MKFLDTEHAPKAIGPYSQATIVNDLIFVSGQIPLNPKTGQIEEDIKLATQTSLSNVLAIVEAAGASLHDIAKVNVYVQDMNDFDIINTVYADFFKDHKPARALVEVSRLPKNVKIEIEAIASLSR